LCIVMNSPARAPLQELRSFNPVRGVHEFTQKTNMLHKAS